MKLYKNTKRHFNLYLQTALLVGSAIAIQSGNCAPATKQGPSRLYQWYKWANGSGTENVWNRFDLSVYYYPNEGLMRSYSASSCLLNGNFCDYSFISCAYYPDTPSELANLDFNFHEGSGNTKITGTISPDDVNCSSLNVFAPVFVNLEGRSAGNSDTMRGNRAITYTDPNTGKTSKTLYNTQEFDFFETFTGSNGFVSDTYSGNAHSTQNSIITPAQ